MFLAIISPILRSTRLCLQLVVQCTEEIAGKVFGVLYHKLQTLSSAPDDGRNYRQKHVELIEITNKLLLLHLVGCLYRSIRDARSHKHQIYVVIFIIIRISRGGGFLFSHFLCPHLPVIPYFRRTKRMRL